MALQFRCAPARLYPFLSRTRLRGCHSGGRGRRPSTSTSSGTPAEDTSTKLSACSDSSMYAYPKLGGHLRATRKGSSFSLPAPATRGSPRRQKPRGVPPGERGEAEKPDPPQGGGGKGNFLSGRGGCMQAARRGRDEEARVLRGSGADEMPPAWKRGPAMGPLSHRPADQGLARPPIGSKSVPVLRSARMGGAGGAYHVVHISQGSGCGEAQCAGCGRVVARRRGIGALGGRRELRTASVVAAASCLLRDPDVPATIASSRGWTERTRDWPWCG